LQFIEPYVIMRRCLVPHFFSHSRSVRLQPGRTATGVLWTPLIERNPSVVRASVLQERRRATIVRLLLRCALRSPRVTLASSKYLPKELELFQMLDAIGAIRMTGTTWAVVRLMIVR
jgi:hypothetical protein